MLKKVKSICSIVISFVMLCVFSVTCYAENDEMYFETFEQEFSEDYGVAPCAALPTGNYYCTSSRYAFIQIESTTSAQTNCTVYNIYCPEKKMYICGTGSYVYNLNSSFQIVISSWFEYGSTSVNYSSIYLTATYSGGNIIVGGETYAKS